MTSNNDIENIGKGKSLLLLTPIDQGITDLLAKGLTELGFDVIFEKKQPFIYKNLFERLLNLIRKHILKDRSYKSRIQSQKLQNTLITELATRNTKLDYTLYLRADTFTTELIEFTKEHSNKVIAYHWDGLKRFNDIFPRISLFDDFFVFDPNDIANHPEYQLKLISNFYFNLQSLPKPKAINNQKKTVYFLGAHLPQRVSMIVNLMNKLQREDIDLKFYIGKPEKSALIKQYENHPVIFLEKGISYEENLKLVSEADIVVDLVNRVHKGLSFRAFEALYYKKKLITNNAEIANYDFYHPANIFIFDENAIDLDEINTFLNSAIVDVAEEIYKKYALSNWIKNILSIEPNINMVNSYQVKDTL